MWKLLLTSALLLGATPAFAVDFTVDVTQPLKPVDHAASGALYGIAAPGWPPQQFIDAIHPKNFTQMAPGGHQLPNGETAPVGDALVVAPVAAEAGGTVTIRMPDTFPDFPYIWRGPEFWTAEVDRIAKATVAANPPNIYAYEIWNEPDWNWQFQWGDFDQMWARTYKAIRAIDPARPVMGPSASKWDAAGMRHFLEDAKASGTLPDIVSWHELDPAMVDDIGAHVTAFRALEAELGLPPRPVSINEYGSQRAMGDPGALVHYIAQLERAGVDTADLAFWHRPGRLSDLLAPRAGGRGPATDPEPTGAYWLYTWYGAMSGSMVAATPAPGSKLDGFAAYDAGRRNLSVVIGGEAGTHDVHIDGLTDFGPMVFVTATATHATGTDGIEADPDPLFSGRFDAGGGKVSIPVDLASVSDAVQLQITPLPAGQMAASIVRTVPHPPTQRLEAENGTISGGRKFTIRLAGNFSANRASGDAYAGLFNKAGASVMLPVDVTAAGKYELTIAYSNGQATALPLALAVNGVASVPLDLPPTQARELFGLVKTTAALPAGKSTLSLTLPTPVSGYAPGPSAVEFDYVDVTALAD